jgi:AhpD family alkylhydroperoxidase
MMAADKADDLFEAARARFGFVPNLVHEMARSAAVARVYLSGQDALGAARLTPAEQRLVQLAIAVYNECVYCSALHGAGCRRAGVAPEDVRAVLEGCPPHDRRLRSVVLAAWQILDTRGWLGARELESLEAEGVDRAQLYEIVAWVGLETISSYLNHMAHTPVDHAFSAE